MRCAVLAACLATGLVVPAGGQAVRLDHHDVTLLELCRELTRQTGVPFHPAEAVAEIRCTIVAENAELDGVMRALADAHRVGFQRLAGETGYAVTGDAGPRPGDLPCAPVSATEVPLKSLARLLGRVWGVTLHVEAGLADRPVTVGASGAIEAALRQVAAAAGARLVTVEPGRVYVFAAAPQVVASAADRAAVVQAKLPVAHLPASALAGWLSAGRGSPLCPSGIVEVVGLDAIGSLVVRGRPDAVDQLRRLLKVLDVPQRAIELRPTLANLTEAEAAVLGLPERQADWGPLGLNAANVLARIEVGARLEVERLDTVVATFGLGDGTAELELQGDEVRLTVRPLVTAGGDVVLPLTLAIDRGQGPEVRDCLVRVPDGGTVALEVPVADGRRVVFIHVALLP